MAPKKSPHPDSVAAAQQRLAAAKTRRDETKTQADCDFWNEVAAAIDGGELLQAQACEAIGYGREYVRRQLLEHKTD
ncbi:hypothetical protein E4198_00130 [Streptomyces sp. RKND-216]|uniref:hypothetical protein n=1 Tax=Streptomyces sp. RKND-216 TaxID=2562581 RepID=UPI00109DE61C|nr:hypothetical protein [Streptomyces sp. RKND-216]THA28257.1 hypothetical protein E4198_00130 [Streptomyces sp. RKND-216]